jgi:hypothetical protein
MKLAAFDELLSLQDPLGLDESLLHVLQIQVSSVKLKQLAGILRGEVLSKLRIRIRKGMY